MQFDLTKFNLSKNLTMNDVKRLLDCLFFCKVIVQAESKIFASKKGIEIRDKFNNGELNNLSINDINELPCTTILSEIKSNSKTTQDLLLVLCLEHGEDAQSLFCDDEFNYLSITIDPFHFESYVKNNEYLHNFKLMFRSNVGKYIVSFPEAKS